jgi:hypothetical protein
MPLLGVRQEDESMSELDTQDRKELRTNQFAYVDRDGGEHLPINDASHVRNAIARFNQTEFESKTAKEEARRRILRAAERFDIEVDDDSNVKQRAD